MFNKFAKNRIEKGNGALKHILGYIEKNPPFR